MPFSYEEGEVRDYWSFSGDIADLQLMRFPDTGRFKGMAFITYADAAGYEAALACDGAELEGKTLRVRLVLPGIVLAELVRLSSEARHGGSRSPLQAMRSMP